MAWLQDRELDLQLRLASDAHRLFGGECAEAVPLLVRGDTDMVPEGVAAVGGTALAAQAATASKPANRSGLGPGVRA